MSKPEHFSGVWEERWHPLREEWVIVAAHRQNRPWSGESLEHTKSALPQYLDDCYLCPGNFRVGGARNPIYDSIFVFDNDHPCVGGNAPEPVTPSSRVYKNRRADGIARVVCYSPRHDLTLAELETSEVAALLTEWQRQYRELSAMSNVTNVLIFENKGEAVGVSNPHPHCQIYATNFVFKTIDTEARASANYFQQSGRLLFQDIIEAEKQDGRRVIAENDNAIAFLPYFARYAYEVYVAPKRTVPSLADLNETEIADFAFVLRATVTRFDNLWEIPFPYVMPLHQAPSDGGDYSKFHFHIQFHPPMRKPNLLKYLAGPEIGGGNFLSDTSPEEKAAELKAVSPIHYKHRK